VDRDLAYAEQKLGFMSATERDLAPYKKGGGKLLMYTGWADPVVPPLDTIAYYESVVKTMGIDKTRDFLRFYLAPGMGHCSGGPGPNQFDMLGALEQWVERGVAPDRIIASHSTGGKVDRTRPLCPYPLVARHKGAGSTDDAANFACVSAPPPAPAAKSTTGAMR
jgi:feruloyl esterase